MILAKRSRFQDFTRSWHFDQYLDFARFRFGGTIESSGASSITTTRRTSGPLCIYTRSRKELRLSCKRSQKTYGLGVGEGGGLGVGEGDGLGVGEGGGLGEGDGKSGLGEGDGVPFA